MMGATMSPQRHLLRMEEFFFVSGRKSARRFQACGIFQAATSRWASLQRLL